MQSLTSGNTPKILKEPSLSDSSSRDISKSSFQQGEDVVSHPWMYPTQTKKDENNEVEISHLLDQLVLSLKEIKTKVEDHEGFLDKFHQFLISKYSSSLSESDIEDIRDFILESCCALIRRYSRNDTGGKRKANTTENTTRKRAGVQRRG